MAGNASVPGGSSGPVTSTRSAKRAPAAAALSRCASSKLVPSPQRDHAKAQLADYSRRVRREVRPHGGEESGVAIFWDRLREPTDALHLASGREHMPGWAGARRDGPHYQQQHAEARACIPARYCQGRCRLRFNARNERQLLPRSLAGAAFSGLQRGLAGAGNVVGRGWGSFDRSSGLRRGG